MCETVGSIMKIHGGQGRNLHPANFSKEIFLKFNLPPLHIMKQKVIPEVARDLVLNEKKVFQTKSIPGKLKFDELSASVGNFRKNEENNSHLPTSIFKCKLNFKMNTFEFVIKIISYCYCKSHHI